MYQKIIFSLCVAAAVVFGWTATQSDGATTGARNWPRNQYAAKVVIQFPLLQDLFGYQRPGSG